MDVAVCVKQVLDATIRLQVANGVVVQDAPRPVSRVGAADRAAVEQALALRRQFGGTVMALSVGEDEAREALRVPLARGVDRAVRIARPDALDPVAAAAAVAGVLGSTRVALVLCGGASGDGGSGKFPAELAARLDWPLVTAVAALVAETPTAVRLERRIERGDRELVRCPLPAVLAVDPALAEGRYVSVRALRVAAAQPIEAYTVDDPRDERAQGQRPVLEPPRPRPKRSSGPAAGASPIDRLSHAITGGVQQKPSGGFVEGPADAVAAEIIRFLREKGFLVGRGG
jgi:electron transfer flavoprotein beta subunit